MKGYLSGSIRKVKGYFSGAYSNSIPLLTAMKGSTEGGIVYLMKTVSRKRT